MISKTSLYLIKALSELARLEKGTYLGAKDLAEKIEVPSNYLSKNLQTLANQGLLESQKGKGGGFAIKTRTRSMPLLKIIGKVDDINRWSQCFLGRKECRDEKPCALHNEWKRTRNHYLNFLESHTIKDCL